LAGLTAGAVNPMFGGLSMHLNALFGPGIETGIGIDAGHTNIRLTSSLLVHHFMSGGINQAPSICMCQRIMSGKHDR
jgi:hypothetical protein